MEEKKIQVGNYVFRFVEEGGMPFLEVKVVSGIWSVRYSADNAMYGFLKTIMEDKGVHEYLLSFVRMSYMICNCCPDLDLLKDLGESYAKFIERQSACAPAVSDEEHERILKEEKERYEMKNK